MRVERNGLTNGVAVAAQKGTAAARPGRGPVRQPASPPVAAATTKRGRRLGRIGLRADLEVRDRRPEKGNDSAGTSRGSRRPRRWRATSGSRSRWPTTPATRTSRRSCASSRPPRRGVHRRPGLRLQHHRARRRRADRRPGARLGQPGGERAGDLGERRDGEPGGRLSRRHARREDERERQPRDRDLGRRRELEQAGRRLRRRSPRARTPTSRSSSPRSGRRVTRTPRAASGSPRR